MTLTHEIFDDWIRCILTICADVQPSVCTVTSFFMRPLGGLTLLKHKQGCPTKDRPLSAKDGRLSVWHADQMT